jgi:hypothetical protein
MSPVFKAHSPEPAAGSHSARGSPFRYFPALARFARRQSRRGGIGVIRKHITDVSARALWTDDPVPISLKTSPTLERLPP